ncbi:LemA family protein [Providencia stuartii]|uniref:LemA family protein n=1 Tax=Providencia stuartii TaxID=588 RepID=A0A1S1HMV0_PROST|nr:MULTISPECIES: LemA family protein [Providencia]ELR5039571.1 LemA family protein [Providencia stuartii]ELR5083889.1 LemA family protein [Providencia stuartii]ELR5111897.1 LemA family protein [Providencia stuartii]ELR5298845.1 LemA family protein [Providencia stuartii]MDW7587697.1 LemA family protein [Providencia sp. 2023EL-00965]
MRIFYILLLILIVVISTIFISNYNTIQKNDEAVIASASEVLNQYQRRADLIPNLISTVKGYSNYEKDVLQEVTNARASIGRISVSAQQLTDPNEMATYQNAQQALGQSLSRLLAVSERYPELQASSLYQDLMVQLEGAENRIAVARGNYIKTVREYNTLIRQFPYNLIASQFGYQEKASFNVNDEQTIKRVPVVDFN